MPKKYNHDYYVAHREQMKEYTRTYRQMHRHRINQITKAKYERFQELIPQRYVDCIKQFRNQRGMSMREFAKVMGVATSTVGHWETARIYVRPERFDALFPELAAQLREIPVNIKA